MFVVCVCGCASGAWEILVPQPGIEPVPQATQVQSPSHWTVMEEPKHLFLCEALYSVLWGIQSEIRWNLLSSIEDVTWEEISILQHKKRWGAKE